MRFEKYTCYVVKGRLAKENTAIPAIVNNQNLNIVAT
ncbi:hypothetical protein SLEP1_g45297 [Rubroshorea leprosula]|uniref:Uncharacterized protein n=1 Tax=Rubroshorea leprosula TaxID=152421 RepID=A0AAV5LJC2_9ROSI|nr:hypothetical protein SLEP1_g45297 [Rubroshorea leprosula]